MNAERLTIRDFCPWNKWEVDTEGPRYQKFTYWSELSPEQQESLEGQEVRASALKYKTRNNRERWIKERGEDFAILKLDEERRVIITYKTFQKGIKFLDEYTDTPKYLIDRITGRKYLNETKGSVRLKCVGLFLGTPFIHSVAAVFRIAKVLTFSHFRGEKGTLKEKFIEWGKDLIKIPLNVVGVALLQIAALYGIISPYNGRKLYASLERAIYGDGVLAPCFQPVNSSRNVQPLLDSSGDVGKNIRHLFGSSGDVEGGW